MCGIAGIIRFDRPAAVSEPVVRAMQRALAHRGPDGEGMALTSHAALAHTRLAMVDRNAGAQPIRSRDGRYTLVYNGELYNDAELRARLDGTRSHGWSTRCDSETVLAAWQQWGPAAVEHLDGMFALFVWDEHERCGYAARDRLGVKPLLYRTDLGFAFASEAKALVEAGRRLSPRPVYADIDAVLEYLVAPAFSGVATSMFVGIEVVPPGHVLRVDAEGITTREYWRWTPRADPSVGAPQLRDSLLHAIDRCALADAPVGVFFSGGLDSTIIAAQARDTLDPLTALTVTFEGQAQWDGQTSSIVVSNDTPYARSAARELGIVAHEVPFARADLGDELRALAAVNDALPAWEQELSQRALAREADRRGLRGILVGDAADETHYGYHFLLDAVATERPAHILRRLGTVPLMAEVEARPVERFDGVYRQLVAQWGDDFDDPAERIAATTQLIVRRWLPRLLHNGDIHCMAFGVEPRVPFAANAVLACAQAIAPSRALADGVEKSVLRAAVRGLIPEAVRRRRKSALPKDQGVARRYRCLFDELRQQPHPLVQALVDLPQLHRTMEGQAKLDEPTRAAVFRVLCLQQWANVYNVAPP